MWIYSASLKHHRSTKGRVMTDSVKYYLHPNRVHNKVKRMYKRFTSKYVNKDYLHEFQMPTTFVSYYNLDKLKHDVNYLGWSVYDPSLSSPHTLIFNAIYCDSWNDDNWHEGQCIEVNTILHEFAHYINKCDHAIICDIIERHNGDIDVDSVLSEKQLRYTDSYNTWDYILRQGYNEFLAQFYDDNKNNLAIMNNNLAIMNNNLAIMNNNTTITYNEFYRMCNMSYEHLSFDFYRACYLCWRLYWEQSSSCKKSNSKRHDYPIFAFKDILGYDGHDEQLLQLTVDASRTHV